MFGDGLDQPRPGLGRLQVGQPDPDDAGDRGQRGQQVLQLPFAGQVLAVGRGVLADQHDLPDTLAGQPARLGDDLVDRPGDERAAE